MIIYIYGEDTFRSRQYLSEQVQKFKQTRDPQGLNTSFFDGKKDDIGNIFGEIVSAPFLAEKRMVVVENILSRSDSSVFKELAEFIVEEKTPESTVVIFFQEDAVGKTKDAKEVSALFLQQKYVQKFEVLTGMQMKSWVESEVGRQQGVLADGASWLIANNSSGDMWYVSTLIKQLIAYKKGLAITVADVELFLVQRTTEDVFQIVETILRGDGKKSLSILEAQRDQGFDDHELVGLLIWNLRILLQVRDIEEREKKVSAEEIAKLIAAHPFVVKKSLQLVKNYSFAALQTLYERLLEDDIKLKTGFADQSLLLDLFVMKV
jgi:DNA polymerase-3 subunit delta